ncbi:proline-rich protein 12-like [Kryptolebias marmoratus]|uniref:proline-rich protein 12-like n=1 Tax=Kryptolebias marmoratus TaxID=37003 RepID=UPI0018AC9953|nr:proline-rich protein 12-like [Kryptolebias marmoratus]
MTVRTSQSRTQQTLMPVISFLQRRRPGSWLSCGRGTRSVSWMGLVLLRRLSLNPVGTVADGEHRLPHPLWWVSWMPPQPLRWVFSSLQFRQQSPPATLVSLSSPATANSTQESADSPNPTTLSGWPLPDLSTCLELQQEIKDFQATSTRLIRSITGSTDIRQRCFVYSILVKTLSSKEALLTIPTYHYFLDTFRHMTDELQKSPVAAAPSVSLVAAAPRGRQHWRKGPPAEPPAPPVLLAEPPAPPVAPVPHRRESPTAELSASPVLLSAPSAVPPVLLSAPPAVPPVLLSAPPAVPPVRPAPPSAKPSATPEPPSAVPSKP